MPSIIFLCFVSLFMGTAIVTLSPPLRQVLLHLWEFFCNERNTVEPVKNEIDRILEETMDKFAKSFDNDNAVDYNQNIDPIVYDREKLGEQLQNENNVLEAPWNTRMMMETTPRGNLIMKYNLYKHAFEYYADNHIPHTLLNVAAMRFVLMYRCRDFFVDENYLPKDRKSKLTEAIQKYEESKKKKNAADNKSGREKTDLKNGPFLKPKKVTVTTTTTNPVNPEWTEKKKPEEKTINKFSYMGKLVNFSFLKKPKPIHTMNGFETKQLFDFGKKLSYEEYKKRMATSK